MVLAIHINNRHLYRRELQEMHRVRKTVFIDIHGWNLRATDDAEFDQFDTDRTIYIVNTDASTGRHLSSLRLSPTTAPNLLAEVFPQLCEGPVPSSDDVWELTRICFATHLRGTARYEQMKVLSLAVTEFGLSAGIRAYSVMSYLGFLPQVMSLGFDFDPIGLPKLIDGHEPVQAYTLGVSEETLARFRRSWGATEPVLQFSVPRAA